MSSVLLGIVRDRCWPKQCVCSRVCVLSRLVPTVRDTSWLVWGIFSSKYALNSYKYFTVGSWDKSSAAEAWSATQPYGLVADHASACLVGDCADLPRALVLAIFYQAPLCSTKKYQPYVKRYWRISQWNQYTKSVDSYSISLKWTGSQGKIRWSAVPDLMYG